MRYLRPWINLLLLLVPLVWLGMGASRLVRGVYSYLIANQRLSRIVAAEASRQLEREVRIGDIRLQGNIWDWSQLLQVEAFNVQVAEGKTLQEGVFASAQRIRVPFSWKRLFGKDLQTSLLDELNIYGPYASLVRDAKGRWNFETFIKPQKPEGRRLANKLTVADGRLRFQDYSFPFPAGVPRRPVMVRAADINGLLLMRIDRSMAFEGSGKVQSDLAKDLTFTGVSAPEGAGTDLRMVVNGLQLANLSAQFLPQKFGSVTRGVADVALNLRLPPKPPEQRSQTLAQREMQLPPTRKTDNPERAVKAVKRAGLTLKDIDYHGVIKIADLNYRSPELNAPLENLNGSVQFVNNSLNGELRGQTAGAGIDLKGKVWNLTTPKQAVIAAQGSVVNADLARLIRAFGVERRLPKLTSDTRRQIAQTQGRLETRFELQGSVADPALTLDGHITTLKSGTYMARDVDFQGRYAAKTLYADLRGQYGGGQVMARGHYAFDTQTYRVVGRGRSLNLGSLGLPLKDPLAGTGRVDITAQREKGQTPRLQAQAELERVRFRGQSLATVYARADTVGKQLVLRTLRLEDARGFALASGTVNLETKKLDLTVGADELDLGALAQTLRTKRPTAQETAKALAADTTNPLLPETSSLNLEGIGYLRGKVTGTWEDPRLQARLSAFAVQTGKFGLDQVVADVNVSRDAVIVSQGTALRHPGRLRFSGLATEPFTKKPSLRIAVSAEDVDVRDLLDVAGVNSSGVGLSGTLSVQDIVVEGTPGALHVDRPFRVVLENGIVNGLPIEEAYIDAAYAPEGMRIVGGAMRAANGMMRVSGRVDFNGDIDLQLRGDSFDVQSIAIALPGVSDAIDGTLSFNGTVLGTLEQPRAEIKLSAQNLEYNRFQVGTLQGTALYTGRQFALQNVQLTSIATQGDPNPGTIAISKLSLDPEDKSLVAEGHWDNLRVQRLSELFLATPFADSKNAEQIRTALDQFTDKLQGTLSGTITLAGTTEKPRVTLTWDARDLRAGEYAITSLTGSALLTKERVMIPAPSFPRRWLQMELPGGTIEAREVNAELDGNISADVSARNVDLAFLQKWIGASWAKTITGRGDLFVVAEGKTRTPNLTVSINLSDVGYQGRVINSIEVDRATVTEGKIQADTIRVAATDPNSGQRFTAQASGSVGFTYESPFVKPDAPLNFEANLRDQDIQTLSALMSGQLKESEGRFSAGLNVKGTRAQPVITGTLALNAPRLKLADFDTGLRDVEGTLIFQGDRITVADGFKARSQVYVNGGPIPEYEGGPITLTGSLPLGFNENSTATGEISLHTDKLVVAETPFPGAATGSVNGKAVVDLRIVGTAKEPTLSGEIAVTDMLAALPAEFKSTTGGGTPPIDPRFDVTVHLANNVRLRNAQLDARTEGDIRLTGPLSDPTLFGRLTLDEGKLVLPTARFTIQPPGALTLVYPTYEAGPLGRPTPTMGINVDLRAQTNVTATSIYGTSKNYRVTVSAKGPLTGGAVDPVSGRPRLALTFATDPPDLAGSQEGLARRLAGIWIGEGAIGQIGVNPTQALAAQLTNVFTGSVLPGLFDRPAAALGFEQFSFSYDPIQRLSLNISRRLFGPLYLSYTRSLTAEDEMFTFRLSARFTERFQTSWEVNERNEQRILLEGIWRF